MNLTVITPNILHRTHGTFIYMYICKVIWIPEIVVIKYVNLPLHVTPFPLNPELHAQVNDPDKLVHAASSAQLSVRDVHSLMSKKIIQIWLQFVLFVTITLGSITESVRKTRITRTTE